MDRISFLVVHSEQVIAARRAAAELATQLGFPALDRTILSVVVSEMARNALADCDGGEIVLIATKEGGMVVEARYSGTGGVDRADAFLPGQGWWAVRQGVDDLVIEVGPNRRDTKVTASKSPLARHRTPSNANVMA